MSTADQPLPDSWSASLLELQQAIAANSAYHKHYLSRFIGSSPQATKIRQTVSVLAELRSINTILITGPSGHGKEIIARALHWRPERPFVAVNTAALPETLISALLFGHERGTFTGATETKQGIFEQAADGTVFLDEIGDMPEHLQCTLLRVLQEREVTRLGGRDAIPISCRIVAATHTVKNLRHDLYGRLMQVEVIIPPLIDRLDDVHEIGESLGIPAGTPIELDKLAVYGVRYLQAISTRLKLPI